jgi:hypothetical protein
VQQRSGEVPSWLRFCTFHGAVKRNSDLSNYAAKFSGVGHGLPQIGNQN